MRYSNASRLAFVFQEEFIEVFHANMDLKMMSSGDYIRVISQPIRKTPNGIFSEIYYNSTHNLYIEQMYDQVRV